MKTTINLPDELVTQLRSRGEQSSALREGLSRYFHLLLLACSEMQTTFTEPELSLICDSLNGSIIDERSMMHIAYSIADSIELDGLARKWDVDGEQLLAKIHALSPTHKAALVDAVERFWEAPDGNQPGDILKRMSRNESV